MEYICQTGLLDGVVLVVYFKLQLDDKLRLLIKHNINRLSNFLYS